MIVRNEEDNLALCLEPVADLVNEIIVVDTGSTDKTRQVARRFGAQVFDFAWVDNFAAARNESLRHATGDWIFWIDADDRVDKPNRLKLQRLFGSLGDENKAFEMTYVYLPEPGSVLNVEISMVRLFRNHPEMRWQNRIHEDISPALRARGARVMPTDIRIHHTGYQNQIVRDRKNERDLRLLLMDYADDANNPRTLLNLGRIHLAMGRPADALPVLRRALQHSDPGAPIVRAFCRLIVYCHRLLGQADEALVICRDHRARHPLDAGLWVQEGELREEEGDAAGAESCYLQFLRQSGPDDVTGMSAALLGFGVRQRLSSLYAKQGRIAKAEAVWRVGS